MKDSAGILSLICVALASLAAPTAGWCDRPPPFFEKKSLTPYWETESQVATGTPAYSPAVVDAFRAIDQDGKNVSQDDMNGKISLVNFFFSGCGSLCPIMMHTLQRLEKQLLRNGSATPIGIYSFSVTPQNDSPAVLKDYAKSRGIDLSHWSLLTGEKREIYHLGRDVFQADRSAEALKGEDSFIHSSNVYLVDARRRVRGIYDTQNAQQMAYLAQDIGKLEKEPTDRLAGKP